MNKILKCLLLYLAVFVYIFIILFIYSIYIYKNDYMPQRAIIVSIASSMFLLLGFLYHRIILKKALLVGFLVGVFHILLLCLIYLLMDNTFKLDIFSIIIYIISSMLGSSISNIFKK